MNRDMTTICASKVQWKSGRGNANATELFNGFANRVPNEFAIQSPVTGITKVFRVDSVEAEQAEFWDGEFQIFRATEGPYSICVWNY